MGQPTADRTGAGLFTLTLGVILSATPMGWFGWLVAGVIGAVLFPPKMSKPDKYTELGLNTAQKGIPIPLLYGTVRAGGNYIWKGPIHSKSIRSGSKGGKKQVTGYKYYMRAAIGIAEGPITITRLWKNNDIIRHEGLSTITIYEGATDQLTDPMISSFVDNPVPYRGLSYAAFNLYYIGKNNAQAPNFNFEGHNYVFDDAAGDIPYVVNPYNDTKLAAVDDPARGIALKLYDGRFVIANKDKVEIWNNEFNDREEQWSWNTPGVPAADRYFDVDLIQPSDGGTYLYAIYNGGVNYLKYERINLNYNDPMAEGSKVQSGILESIGTNHGRICHNSSNHFVVWNTGSATKIKKFAWNNLANELAEYTISTDIAFGHPLNIDCNEDYLFIMVDDGKIYSFNFLGILIDSVNVDLINLPTSLCCPSGMKGVVASVAYQQGPPSAPTDQYHNYFFISYDENGTLTLRKTYDGTVYWTDATPPIWGDDDLFDFATCLYRKLVAEHDGTLIFSAFVQAAVKGGIQHMIIDSNPSQVAYDMIVKVRELPDTIMKLTTLTGLSDYCFDNGLGISLLQNSEENLSDFLMNLLQYCHAIMFVNNVGEYEFKPFKNTDPSEADIEERDILAEEFQKVNINLKERAAIPNRITVTFLDRLNNYDQGSFQVDHFLAQEEDGELIEESMDFIWISNPIAAGRHGYKIMKVSQYDTAIFSVTLMPKHLSRNVGDVVTLKLEHEELTDQRIRLISVDEPDLAREGSIKAVARREEDYLNDFEIYPISSGKNKTTSIALPNDVRPFVYEVPALQVNDNLFVRVSAIRFDSTVVGADIFIADSTLNYRFAGSIRQFCFASDVDMAIAVADLSAIVDVEPYPEAIGAYTLDEQMNDVSFAVCGELVDDDIELYNLEFMSHRDVSVSGSLITLSALRRGLYYTLPKAHTTDEVYCLVGDEERYLTIPFLQADIGQTFYLKAVAYNYRGDEQNFDDVTVYEYTVKGLTKKATHVSGLEIEDSLGNGMGSIKVSPWWSSKLRVRWKLTNRMGGIDAQQIDEWPWNRFIEGDVLGYDALIYNSSLTLIATHAVPSGLANLYYDYTQAAMTTDFGGLQSKIYIGIRPYNNLGYMEESDVQLQEINII